MGMAHFVTGSSPFNGGAFGKYSTRGHSGGLCWGSHPNHVGLRFNPNFTKSSVLAGRGGRGWCDELSSFVRRAWPMNKDVPLGQCCSSILFDASTATSTSSLRARTNNAPSGTFSSFAPPSMSSSHRDLLSTNVSGLMFWNGFGQFATSSARVRTSRSCRSNV